MKAPQICVQCQKRVVCISEKCGPCWRDEALAARQRDNIGAGNPHREMRRRIERGDFDAR